ncbi:MAG TPA: GGDEF domain-containing protein [Caulobacterales bacterium]|nr:GGDEF domain-containing protein [Caulobacterales bacterium]
MLFARRKSADETIDPLLAQYGLTPDELTPSALIAFRALAEERDTLQRSLEAAMALADRDTLTPTLNRRAFMRALHRTMSEAERYKTPAAVLYLDLDGFKGVNDEYGHAAGDAVLRQVGRMLVDQVRESDAVGRLGGDEFGVILNRVTADEARAKAELLSAAINHTPVSHAGIDHRVRASIGVHLIDAVEDPEVAVARADEAMYIDKRTHGVRGGFDAF